MQEGRSARFIGVATVACVVLFLFHCGRFWWFTIDDAAISMSYAWNAAHGHGLRLTREAAPVEAYSNPLWVLLMMGPAALGAALEPVAKIGGVLAAAAALPCAVLVARRAGAGRLAPVAAAVLALGAGYALWAQAGLENGLWAGTVAAALLLTVRELDDASARPWSALPLGVLLWIRPEAPLVLAWFGAVRALVVWRRRLPWRRELVVLASVLAGAALLLGSRRLLFHDWLPNSYHAKRYERLTAQINFGRGKRYTWGFIRDYRLYLLAWVPVLALWPRRSRVAAVLALGLMAAAIGFGWYAAGDWAHDYRFLTAAWVGLAVLCALACAALAELVRQRAAGLLAALGVLTLFTVTAAARGAAVRRDPQFRITAAAREADCARLATLAQLLGRERPLVLAIDVGGMSRCGRLEILDYIGLADRSLPHLRDQDPSLREYLDDERAWDLGYGRGEVPRAIQRTPEHGSQYLQLHPRGTHPALMLYVRRELISPPPDFPATQRLALAGGLTLVGARSWPARVRPGGSALVELAVVVEPGVWLAPPWPTVEIALQGAPGGPRRVRAEAAPGADGWGALRAGDALLLRARVDVPTDASGTLTVVAGSARGPGQGPSPMDAWREVHPGLEGAGPGIARVVVDAAAPPPAAPALAPPVAAVRALLRAPTGATFAARRLLAALRELDKVRGQARALGLPAPAAPPALALRAAVARALLGEAAGLPPDAAYARLRLARLLAPRSLEILRAIDGVRRHRLARYSFLEAQLTLAQERAVRLGRLALARDAGRRDARPRTEAEAQALAQAQAQADDAEDVLAVLYLDQGRDLEALAMAHDPCLRSLAAANLALAEAPACAAWDPVRARQVLALPAAPAGDLEGFEAGLGGWTPGGDWPHHSIPSIEHKTPAFREAWSGEARAGSGPPAARGTLESPPFLVRHRFVGFLLGTRGPWGRAPPEPDGPALVRLLVDGRVALEAHAVPAELPRAVFWDLGSYAHHTATIQVEDGAGNAWVAIDAVTFLSPLARGE